MENVTQELKNTIERNRYGHDSLADSDDSFVINRPSALHGELEEVVKRLEKENQMLKNLSG